MESINRTPFMFDRAASFRFVPSRGYPHRRFSKSLIILIHLDRNATKVLLLRVNAREPKALDKLALTSY